MVWIDLTQDWDKRWAVKNAGIDLFVPSSARNFLTSYKAVSFLKMILLHEVSCLVSYLLYVYYPVYDTYGVSLTLVCVVTRLDDLLCQLPTFWRIIGLLSLE